MPVFFANYDKPGKLPDGSNTTIPYGGKINTTLVKFDKHWQVLEGFIYPKALTDRWGDMSNSGGSWGPDGNLYISGHDPAEVYKVRFPTAGSLMESAEIIPVNIRGQGIAWDHARPGVFYGIIRATSAEVAQGLTHRVTVFQTNVRPRRGGFDRNPDRKEERKEDSNDGDRFHP